MPYVLAVLVDPVPQRLARRLPQRARSAVDADDVGCKPVAVAAAQAAAMEGAVVGGLQPACDRLAIVVAECAGDAGRQAGLFGGEQQAEQPQLEFAIHAADHVVGYRHVGVFGGLRVLPAKVLIDHLRHGPRDRHHLALALDRHLALGLLLDGVFLARALVERPQVAVGAGIDDVAFVEDFGGADDLLAGVGGVAGARLSGLLGRRCRRQRFRRIAQRGGDDRLRLRFGLMHGWRGLGGGFHDRRDRSGRIGARDHERLGWCGGSDEFASVAAILGCGSGETGLESAAAIATSALAAFTNCEVVGRGELRAVGGDARRSVSEFDVGGQRGRDAIDERRDLVGAAARRPQGNEHRKNGSRQRNLTAPWRDRCPTRVHVHRPQSPKYSNF